MLLGKCFWYLFNWISLASLLTSEVLGKRHELTWNTNIFSCWNDNHAHTNICLNVEIYELHQSNWQARKHWLFFFFLSLSEYCWKGSELLLKFICRNKKKNRHIGELLNFHLWLANLHISLHKNICLGILVKGLTLDNEVLLNTFSKLWSIPL